MLHLNVVQIDLDNDIVCYLQGRRNAVVEVSCRKQKHRTPKCLNYNFNLVQLPNSKEKELESPKNNG